MVIKAIFLSIIKMINNFLQNKREESAFSLIELSVVLAIIAVIISGSLVTSTTVLTNKRIDTTKDRLEIIEEALLNFVRINKRLPCPARLDLAKSSTSYGAEDGTSGDCNNTNDKSESGAGEILAYGMLPIQALGLDIDMASDGFDNKFSYIVAKSLTATTLVSGLTAGFDGLDVSSTNNIDVEEYISSGSTITSIAAYIILSHGPNGYGAYNVNATIPNTQPSNSHEQDNRYTSSTSHTSPGTYDDDFIASSSSPDFDDIIIFDSRDKIKMKLY